VAESIGGRAATGLVAVEGEGRGAAQATAAPTRTTHVCMTVIGTSRMGARSAAEGMPRLSYTVWTTFEQSDGESLPLLRPNAQVQLQGSQ